MRQYIEKFVLVILLAVICGGCIGNSAELKSGDSEKPLPSEMSVKQSLSLKLPPTNALSLNTEKSFTSNNGKIVFPSSLIASDDGQIYLSDNNGQSIYKISADLSSAVLFSKEKTEKDEEKLKYPNTIRFHQKKIFVADNDGIKIFKENGELEKIVRSYYSINDFSLDSEGNFFINANFLDANQGNHLIIKLDQNGTRVSGIGQRPNPLENKGIEGKAFIEVAEQNIIVAYKHLPLVQIYDSKSGDLIREFEIKHPVFDELKKLKDNKEFVNPKTGVVVLPRYFAGVKASDNKIYLLLHLPKPEIVEVDFQGKELNRYRSETLAAMNYFGFDVRSVGGVRQFWVGVIEPSRAPTVAALNQNAKIQNTKP